MRIPPMQSILERCQDLRRDAQLQRDASGIKAYNAIIASVVCDYAVLAWDGPYLTVASESAPGTTHQVSGFGCSCDARRPCWHQRLRDLLISVFETECETSNMEAEMETDPDTGPNPIPHAAAASEWLGGQITLAQRLTATAQLLATLRSALTCDPPGDNPLGDDEGDELPSRRPLGMRLSQARRRSAFVGSAFYLAA